MAGGGGASRGTGSAAGTERRRQSRTVPPRAETRHRRGQDHRHGDADRLADAQPGADPRVLALHRAFLVVAPGITIRDRLRVLLPSDPDNNYTLRELVPPDMRDTLQQARIVITNYHAFQRRETMAAPKLSKAILGGRSGPVQTLESEGR